MSDDRELRLKVKVEDEASRPLHTIGDSADGAKTHLDGMNTGLKKLDKQVADTKKSIAGLREEVAKTGDLGLVKDIQKQEQRLKAFERQRKSLIGDGEKEAQDWATKFTEGAISGLEKMPLGPALAPAIAALAPAITTSVAGAVTLGVATAAVGAGLTIAFKDPQVKAAGQGLAADIGDELKSAAAPFVPAALDAIGTVRDEFHSLRPELNGIFADAAKYVQPLAQGVSGFVRELLPGIQDATHNAEPLIKMLGDQLPQAGQAFGEVLRSLSDDAGTTAQALDGVLTSVEGTLVGTAKLIEYANKAYPYLGPGVLPWIGAIDTVDTKTKNAAGSTRLLADEQKNLQPPVDNVNAAYRGQIDALDELANKMREQADPMFALIQAQKDLAKTQNDYNTAVRKHGENSPAAQEALRKMAEAALKVEGATGKAAGMFDGHLTPAMHATLRAAGFTENQIHDLEKQFATAKTAGDKFAKTYKANVVVTYEGLQKDFIGPVSPTSPWGHKAGGGPVDAGKPYLVGEEGPELVVPKSAGMVITADKTRDLLRAGMQQSPLPAMAGAGTQVIEHVHRFDTSGSDRSILAAIIRAIRDGGGDPTVLGL